MDLFQDIYLFTYLFTYLFMYLSITTHMEKTAQPIHATHKFNVDMCNTPPDQQEAIEE